jgi:hypothetical protein
MNGGTLTDASQAGLVVGSSLLGALAGEVVIENVTGGNKVSGYGTIGSALANSGTLAVSGGSLTVAGALSGSGTVTVAAGDTLDLAGGAALAGVVSGAGAAVLGASSTITTSASVSVARMTIEAGTTLTGAGKIGSIVADSGSIAAAGGTLTLSKAISGAGTLAAAAGATLDITGGGAFTGAISGAGTIGFAAATTLEPGAVLSASTVVETANLTLGSAVDIGTAAGHLFDIAAKAGAAVTLGGPAPDAFTNSGTLEATGAGTADVKVKLINARDVSVGSGTLAFLGAVTNSGTMTAAGAVLSISTSVGGTGTLDIGASGTLSLLDGSAAGQKADFLATTGLLDLTKPAAFAGTIGGFGGSDVIDLLKTAATSLSFASGVLTVKHGSTVEASLHLSGSYTTADFALSSDGHAGTFIKFV